MADSVSELITVLSEKRAVIEELITVLNDEQRCIVDLDIPGLELRQDKKMVLLEAIKNSSDHCRELIKAMAVELNVPNAESLSPLLPKVAAAQRGILKGLQSRLLELGAALNRILAYNGELLQGSLQNVTNSLEFFNRLFTNTTTYGEAGRMVTGRNDVRLICKEI